MNKTTKRLFSLFLAVIMLMFNSSTVVFAGEGDEKLNEDYSAVFTVDKASETATEVKFTLTFSSGDACVFNAAVNAAEKLTDENITVNTDAGVTSDGSVIFYSSEKSLTENTQVAEITYTKPDAAGIVKADFTVSIECAPAADSQTTFEPEVVYNIPESYSALFGIAKESETTTEVKFSLTYTSGDAVKFVATALTELTDGAVTVTEGIEGLSESGGVVTYSGTSKLSENTKIAEYTYTKAAATGIVQSDFTVEVKDCFADTENGIAIAPAVTNNIPLTHTHVEAESYVVTVPSTCTVQGTEVLYCAECGSQMDSRDAALDKNNHVNTVPNKIDSTCTEEGEDQIYCNDCNKVVSSTPIAMKAHKYVLRFKNSTCTEDGYSYRECLSCKKRIEEEVIKATNHKWDEWTVVKNASTSDDGLKRRKCKYCNKIEEVVIPKIVVPVKEIVLLPEGTITMDYGKTATVYINVLPEDAMYSADLVVTSSNTRVATVDKDGTITAKGFGSAVITVKTADGKVSAQKNVQVRFSIIQFFVFIFDKIFGRA